MSDTRFDVIIIGSGAGGGTLARQLAPTGKRILILERGQWLPREAANWDSARGLRREPLRARGHVARREGQALPAGRPLLGRWCHQGLRRGALPSAREDFGELRHHDGVSPAWPISYDEFEPYYTRAEQLFEVHGARGEDPTEGHSSAPYPFPALAHEPRIQQLSDDLVRAGYHPFHAPCGVRLLADDMVNSRCIRCQTCDGFPCLVQAKSDAEMLGVRPALRASQRHHQDRRARPEAEHQRGRDGRHRGRRRAGRRDRDVPGGHRGGLGRGRQLRAPAAGFRQRQASAGARQRFRPARAQLHVPQQRGRAGHLQGTQPDHVPEDAGAQRLLLRDRRLRLPDGQHPDGRQVRRPDVQGREAPRDQAGADVQPRRGGPSRGRLLAVDRGPAGLRQPRHA